MTFAEADLNHDGRVSISEAEYISNSGVHDVVKDGRTCSEYFSLKDGLPIKVVCP